jgi:ribonuclease HI
MSTYECQSCGRSFAVPQKTLDQYPSWQPKNCLRCHSASKPAASRPANRSRRPRLGSTTATAPRFAGRPSVAAERVLTLSDVLKTYSDGPATGVFTDGAAHPNPGPGGWGAVFVVDNAIIAQARGAEPQTTNNRMELTALLAGYGMVPPGTAAVVLTDSQLCVDTINSWAADWERNGWKRRRGEIKNLDLVQELYRVAKARPEIELRWIKSHNGYRWNEYADALASAYRRPTP